MSISLCNFKLEFIRWFKLFKLFTFHSSVVMFCVQSRCVHVSIDTIQCCIVTPFGLHLWNKCHARTIVCYTYITTTTICLNFLTTCLPGRSSLTGTIFLHFLNVTFWLRMDFLAANHEYQKVFTLSDAVELSKVKFLPWLVSFNFKWDINIGKK